jgi:hypothetical protein
LTPAVTTAPARSAIVIAMSTMTIVYTLIVLVMAYRLADMYLGGHYVCPRCGTRTADGHADDCPWQH